MTDINKNTVVEIGGKKVTLEALAKMMPALGLVPAAPAAEPAKPARKIVSSAKAPSGTSALAAAALALTPTAPAPTVPVTVPASTQKFPEVLITIKKEFVALKDGEAPVEMFVLSKRCPSPGGKGKPRKGEPMSHFNYRFDKGFAWHNTQGATPPKPGWKWDSKREVRYIPLDALETLLRGLHETYAGATLHIGDQIVTL